MRVASSDWWPSRMVVSVTSTRLCSRIHLASALGPRDLSKSRVPGWMALLNVGTTGLVIARGLARLRVSGWPLTVTSAT